MRVIAKRWNSLARLSSGAKAPWRAAFTWGPFEADKLNPPPPKEGPTDSGRGRTIWARHPFVAVTRPSKRMMLLRAKPAAVGLAAVLATLLFAPNLRAETVVLRNGMRITVTSYQIAGEKYRLQLSGGVVEVAVEEVVTIEPQLLFAPEAPTPQPTAAGPYREFIEAAAVKYKVDADLISSVIAIESNFDPKAVSRRNARGLMQLMPQTAAQLGVQNIFDPKENIDGGTHLLRDLLERYNNDLVLALAAYNAGTERVVTEVPPFRETRNYVVKVKKKLDQRKVEKKSAKPPTEAQVLAEELARSVAAAPAAAKDTPAAGQQNSGGSAPAPKPSPPGGPSGPTPP